MKFIFPLILSLFSIVTYGQDTDTIPDFNFLKFSHSRFSLLDEDGYVIQKKLYKKDMEGLLANNFTALKKYERYRTTKTIKNISKTVFFSSLGTGVGILFSGADEAGFDVITASLLYYLAVHLPISITTGSKARQVTDLHNHAVRKEQRRYSFTVSPVKNGIGLIIQEK